MHPLLALIAVSILCTGIFQLATVLTMLAYRVRIREFSVGFGTIARKQVGGVLFKFGLFPFGGYIGVSDHRFPSSAVGPEKSSLSARNKYLRTFLALSGPCALLGTAFLLIGKDAFWAALVAPRDIFLGALHPHTTAPNLLTDAANLLSTPNSFEPLGVAAAKFAAFNLLPLPILPGGRALLELFDQLYDGNKILNRASGWSFFIFAVFLGIWLYALIRWWLV